MLAPLRGNTVLGMAKPLLSMLICPEQSQRNKVVHRRAAVWTNLGGRLCGGSRLGFHRRVGFGGLEPTQSMHVVLTYVCMCVGGLGDALAIGFPGRCDLPPTLTPRFVT
jgi:hypothetical protein